VVETAPPALRLSSVTHQIRSATLVIVRPFAAWPLALALPLLAACRVGFDRVPDGRAPGPDVPPPPPLPVLSCGASPQFALDRAMTGLAATATDDGYYVFTVDDNGDVHGFSYEFDGDALAAATVDAPVFSGATGTVAAIDTGDGVLAAMQYGRPDAAGTALVPLDGRLAPRAAPQMHLAWYGLDSTVARGTSGGLAFLGQDSSGQVVAKLVSPTGQDLGAPHVAIDAGEDANIATIVPSSAGFLVTWAASTPSPNEVRAELLDKQLGVVLAPVTINPGATRDAVQPRAAYAAAADRYLFVWYSKLVSGEDELRVSLRSLRDRDLVEITQFPLTLSGVLPRVIAGKDDFLVVWQDKASESGLEAARIKFDGSHGALAVSGRGGKAVGWDLVTRAGQPAVVWLEDDGTRRTMWLNALCN